MITHLTLANLDLSVLRFWCFHITLATMTKNTILTTMISITGAMKAQMKLVSVFKKHLQIETTFSSVLSSYVLDKAYEELDP